MNPFVPKIVYSKFIRNGIWHYDMNLAHFILRKSIIDVSTRIPINTGCQMAFNSWNVENGFFHHIRNAFSHRHQHKMIIMPDSNCHNNQIVYRLAVDQAIDVYRNHLKNAPSSKLFHFSISLTHFSAHMSDMDLNEWKLMHFREYFDKSAPLSMLFFSNLIS